jgi:hypothetical protein
MLQRWRFEVEPQCLVTMYKLPCITISLHTSTKVNSSALSSRIAYGVFHYLFVCASSIYWVCLDFVCGACFGCVNEDHLPNALPNAWFCNTVLVPIFRKRVICQAVRDMQRALTLRIFCEGAETRAGLCGRLYPENGISAGAIA